MLLKRIKPLAFLVFILYLALLFYLLFFSAYRNGVQGIVDYNLIPFKTINRYFHYSFQPGLSMVTDEFFGNILAFLPFGFFLPFLFAKVKSTGLAAGWTFLLSLTVEIAQFIFRVGAFDVDDLILNTIGGSIGYSIWYIFLRKTLLDPRKE
ncbi:VanZ family protein [Bacillus sp. B-jedd]|uniref:VanZ family protein n=1 Tax=Bacillus sp. B-jedd TaxID=1476857 RepID=UPI0006624B0A|nr:VanZ family protein [Bacillus sp. B-jedd]